MKLIAWFASMMLAFVSFSSHAVGQKPPDVWSEPQCSVLTEASMPALVDTMREFAEREILPTTETNAPRKKFKLGISIYTGWMFWYWLNDSGVLSKWAKAYNIEIEVVEYGVDYMKSVGDFSSEGLDAVVITTMDTLTGPALTHDCSVIIIGDYSNGNDAILARRGLTVEQLAGKTMYLADDSVSEYLVHRAFQLKGNKKTLADLGAIANMTDAKIVSTMKTDEGATDVATTWNPAVLDLMQLQGKHACTNIFNSAEIPEEILDVLVCMTTPLKENPAFGKALTGAFYEALARSKAGWAKAGVDKDADAIVDVMAKRSDVPPDLFREMMKTTAMYATPQDALAFATGPSFVNRLNTVRRACLELAKLGGQNGIGIGVKPQELAKVGVQLPDGTLWGKEENIGMRLDLTYMQMAAKGELTRGKD